MTDAKSSKIVLRNGQVVDEGILYSSFNNLVKVLTQYPFLIYDLKKFAQSALGGGISEMEYLSVVDGALVFEGKNLFNTLPCNVPLYDASISEGKIVNPISSLDVNLGNVNSALELMTCFAKMLHETKVNFELEVNSLTLEVEKLQSKISAKEATLTIL